MSEQKAEVGNSESNNRILSLDTETTGFSYEAGHKIIEIGIVELIGGVRTNNNFHCYLDPQREVDEGAQEVHGLDWENLEILSEGKIFKDIYSSLVSYLNGAHVVAHNAPFDFGHLDAECRRLGLPELSHQLKISDSLALSNNIYPGRRNNLDALARRFNIDASNRKLHGALIDADILADVYLCLVEKQKEMGLSRGDSSSTSFNINNRKKIQFTPISPELSSSLKVVSPSEEDIALNDDMVLRIQKSSGDEGFTF